MLPTRSLERQLESLPTELRDILLEIRNLVVSIAPDAIETLHSKGISYYHAGGHGPVSAGICQIIIFNDHIRLAFIHGNFLPDPKKLLEGGEKYKRYTRLSSYEKAPWEDLKDLIAASARFDPYTLKFR